MKRLFAVLNALFAFWILAIATPFGISNSIPEANSEIPMVQQVTLEFDVNALIQENPTVTTWYVGGNVYGGSPTVALKKGEEIIAQLDKAINIVEGTSISFSFENPIVLNPGEEYVIYISAGSFNLLKSRRNGIVESNAEILIPLKGEVTDVKTLSLSGTIPAKESVLESLSKVLFEFNEEVEIIENAEALLIDRESNQTIATTLLSIEQDNKTVSASFLDAILYNEHRYIVEIPENSIFIKGQGSNGYQKISIDYLGASYKSFGYGRINPKNNAEISYLANIEVPVNCSDSEYLGRDFKATMQLYKMDGENAVAVGESVECVVNGTAKGVIAPFYTFDLEPSSSYQVVLEADQFCLWDYETQKPMRDTANERLVLNYTTPAVIDPLPRQGFKSAVPDGSEPIENLTSLRVDFAPYEFEDVFYYPVFPSTLTEGYNLVKFVDVTTGDESTFPVEIKWDDANNYWLENSAEINYTLLKGHDYQVVIPAGMFRCRLTELGDNSANEEYVINLKGNTRTEFDVTYSIPGSISMTTVVPTGQTATFKVTPNEGFEVESVTFNGEPVEVVDEMYTTPAIEDDAIVAVTYKYAGVITFDFSTGVDEVTIDSCEYSVALEGDHIIIGNLKADSRIYVYNTAGMLLGEEGNGSDDIVKISASNGVIYIIVIADSEGNKVALKIKH